MGRERVRGWLKNHCWICIALQQRALIKADTSLQTKVHMHADLEHTRTLDLVARAVPYVMLELRATPNKVAGVANAWVEKVTTI